MFITRFQSFEQSVFSVASYKEVPSAFPGKQILVKDVDLNRVFPLYRRDFSYRYLLTVAFNYQVKVKNKLFFLVIYGQQ